MIARYFTIITFFILTLTVYAQEPSNDLLTGVAYNFINQNFPSPEIYRIEQIRTLTPDSVQTMYIVDLSPEGWILMTADLRLVPVIGFSFTGRYEIQERNPNNAQYNWIDQYNSQIKKVIFEKSTGEQPGWEVSKKSQVTKKGLSSGIWVSNLINVLWDQGRNWNQFCPVDSSGPGDHVYAGCIAVSMAQAMSAFSRPVTGTGSNSYYTSGYGTQYVDFSSAIYKWDSMSLASADQYNARLLYHCAVSVNMDFGPDASSARMIDASSALKKNFIYSKHTTLIQRLSNDQDWMDLLNSELLSGRPLIYSGDADDGTAGHAFNIDGVANSTYYHINWGWHGTNNGYYTINALRPGSYDLTKNHAAIKGIQPYYYPTNIVLSDTIVIRNYPAGEKVGVLSVVDEATDNVYSIKLFCDSTFNGSIWVQDYYMDGDSLKTGRVFTDADYDYDTVRFTLRDKFENTLEKKISLNITNSLTGINLNPDNQQDVPILYPNPVSEQIFFVPNIRGVIRSVNVFSASGLLLKHYNNISGDSLSVSDLSPGLYIFEIIFADHTVAREKIIIR